MLSPSDLRAASKRVPAMKLSSSKVKNSATTSTTSTSYIMSSTIRSTKSTPMPMCSMPTGCSAARIGIDTTYWLPTRTGGGQMSGLDMPASTAGLRKCAAAPPGGEKRSYRTLPCASVTATYEISGIEPFRSSNDCSTPYNSRNPIRSSIALTISERAEAPPLATFFAISGASARSKERCERKAFAPSASSTISINTPAKRR